MAERKPLFYALVYSHSFCYYHRMTTKRKIALVVLTVVCGVMLLFSFEVFRNASSQELMPLMEESIGKTASEINDFSPALLTFIFTLMKVIPSLLFSFNIGILILLFGPFRRSKKWASAAIFIPLIVWLTSAILIYRELAAAPWQLWLVLLILVALALILTLTDNRRSI